MKKNELFTKTTFPKIKQIPTGSYVFDFLTGGGLPIGKIIEFFGEPSSGKTSFTLLFLSQFPGKALYFDFEQGLDKQFLAKFNLSENIKFSSELVDAVSFPDILVDAFKTNDLIVVDSLAAIQSTTEALAQHALTLTKALRKVLPYLKQDKTLLLLNQLRTQSYGGSIFVVDSGGGYALKHFTHLRVRFDKKVVKGSTQEIEFKIVKSKTPGVPYNRATIKYDFLKCKIDYSYEFMKLGEIFGILTQTETGIIINETGETVTRRGYHAWFRKNEEFALKTLQKGLAEYYKLLEKGGKE